MDLQTLIELYGLPGLVIGGLVLDRLRLQKRLDSCEDGRRSDGMANLRETLEVAHETQKALDAIQRVLEAQIRE